MFSSLTVHKKRSQYICKFHKNKTTLQQNHFQGCGKKDCRVCEHYDYNFINGYGKFVYETVNENNKTINCYSENVVYQIFCNKCNYSYVGETGRTLKKRFSEHLYHIGRGRLDTLLVAHFSKVHSKQDVRIRVVHKLHDGCPDGTRLDAEDFWIHQLMTIYPFGLNDKITGMSVFASDLTNNTERNIHHFFSNPIPVKRKSKNKNNSAEKVTKYNSNDINMNNYELIRKLPNIFYSTKKNKINDIKTSILSKDDHMLRLASEILTKIKNKKHVKSKDEIIPLYIPVEFPNSVIDQLGLRNMVHDSVIERDIGIKKNNLKIVPIYKLPKTNFVRFSNYNSILRTLETESLIKVLRDSCDCCNSTYKDPFYNHILTGNTNVINDPKIAYQLSQGTKYRQEIVFGLNNFRGILYKFGHDIIKSLANKMKDQSISVLKDKIATRLVDIGESRWIRNFGHISVIQQNKFVSRFNNNDLVITSVDKAGNNFSFICKKLYLNTICSELGITFKNETLNVTGNKTYTLCTDDTKQIFNKYIQFYSERKIKIENSDLRIPMIFAIPKFHKNPVKFRFIAGAKSSVSKPLHLVTVNILSFVKNYIMHYCDVTRNRSGINMFWSINSSNIVTNKCKSRDKFPNELFCADFSNLFTSLPHNEILYYIMYLVEKTFEANKKNGNEIQCNLRNAFFSKKLYKGYASYPIAEVNYMIKFLIENSYVQFAGMNFVQLNGIPQGGNASPILADLTLTGMEIKFMQSQNCDRFKKELSLTFRYIDDVLSFSTHFHNLNTLIYGNVLELNRTDDKVKTAFLDINIQLENNKPIFTTFDKTRQFNFNVIKYPKYNSCIPASMISNVLITEIIRFSRTNNTYSGLELNISILFNIFSKNGCPENFMKKSIDRILGNKKYLDSYLSKDTISILKNLRAKMC